MNDNEIDDLYDDLVEIKARLNSLVFVPKTMRQHHEEADAIRRLLNKMIQKLWTERQYQAPDPYRYDEDAPF